MPALEARDPRIRNARAMALKPATRAALNVPGHDMNACSCDDMCMSHGSDSDPAFLSAEAARSVAETMHALAAPSRVRILSRLAAHSCSVGELAREIGMEQSAVSQQLRVLRHLGLVVGERDLKFRTITDQMAEAIPHAEVTVVPRSGHAVHLEAPQAVAQAIARF